MSSRRFSCSLRFAHAYRATQDEIATLLDKMTDSFCGDGVVGLSMGGDIQAGTLEITFEPPPSPITDEEDGDSLWGLALVVRALNCGRISAPGWPDDEVVDGAIASVTVREFSLA